MSLEIKSRHSLLYLLSIIIWAAKTIVRGHMTFTIFITCFNIESSLFTASFIVTQLVDCKAAAIGWPRSRSGNLYCTSLSIVITNRPINFCALLCGKCGRIENARTSRLPSRSKIMLLRCQMCLPTCRDSLALWRFPVNTVKRGSSRQQWSKGRQLRAYGSLYVTPTSSMMYLH